MLVWYKSLNFVFLKQVTLGGSEILETNSHFAGVRVRGIQSFPPNSPQPYFESLRMPRQWGVVTHLSSSTLKVGAGGPGGQGQSWLRREFGVSLGYMRPVSEVRGGGRETKQKLDKSREVAAGETEETLPCAQAVLCSWGPVTSGGLQVRCRPRPASSRGHRRCGTDGSGRALLGCTVRPGSHHWQSD